MRTVSLLAAIVFLGSAQAALTQSGESTKVITEGSPSVDVGGRAAALKGDQVDPDAAVSSGSKNVFIGGKPAARAGDRTGCGGLVVDGSSNAFVNGKPLAAAGGKADGC